jgi:hypothetical protein
VVNLLLISAQVCRLVTSLDQSQVAFENAYLRKLSFYNYTCHVLLLMCETGMKACCYILGTVIQFLMFITRNRHEKLMLYALELLYVVSLALGNNYRHRW